MKEPLYRSVFIVFLASCVFVFPLWASESGQAEHRIDRWLDQAIKKDYSTVGMREAQNKALKMWDKEMNACYKRLMNRLPENKQKTLKKAQRAWVAFRDADAEVIGDILYSQGGTAALLNGDSAIYERVRQRTLQLLAYEAALP